MAKARKAARPRAETQRDNPGQRGEAAQEAIKAAFLKAFLQLGANLKRTCGAIGVGRTTVYRWRREDPGFDEAIKEAQEDWADELEAVADQRATEGVEKPVFYKGKVVGTVKEPSDTLLIFRLKALRRSKYSERQEQIALTPELMSRLSDDELERISAGEDPLVVLAESARSRPS